MSKEEAIEKARKDMAKRMGVSESDITIQSIDSTDFPDMALGASTEDEMTGQMITPGWKIRLKGSGKTLEYRANKHQLRLYNFKGENHKV